MSINATTKPSVSVLRRSQGMAPIRALSGADSSWMEFAISGVATSIYGFASVARFLTFRSGIDLGLFGQAVRSYAAGQLPWSTLKTADGHFDLLGDHFTPIVALLAPLYALWPHIELLLIAQAVLIGSATWLITRHARLRLGGWLGAAIGVSFAFSWGVSFLALFDFHEVAFALPVLALALIYARARHWRSAITWACVLLFVKEDCTFLVFGIGLYALATGARRVGVIVMVGAVTAFGVIVYFVIPYFSYYGRYTYWAAVGSPGPLSNLEHAVTSPQGLALLGLIAVCGLAIPFLSPLCLVLLPPLLARFATDNPMYWAPGMQYDGTIAVIVFVALIDVLDRRRRLSATPLRRSILVSGLLVVCFAISAFGPLAAYTTPSAYRCAQCGEAKQALRIIPDGATVAASTYLVDHLVDTHRVELLEATIADSAGHPLRPEWIAIDLTHSDPGMSLTQVGQTIHTLTHTGYHVVFDAGGYAVLELIPAA